MNIKNCRLCNGKLKKVLSLGKLPIVNYFPTRKEISTQEKYPLNFCLCQKCGLAQIDFILPKELLFRKYHYLSSASKPLVSHLAKLALFCIKRFCLNQKSKVLDIGSNDGSFLLNLRDKKIETLGVEPVPELAQMAIKQGVATLNKFFDSPTARYILEAHGQFDLIVASHVLANILDLPDFIKGVKMLLKKNGIFVAEVGSLEEMLKKGHFDSIYHEHYSYFSQVTLKNLLKSFGLTPFLVEKNAYQGGSIRVYSRNSKFSSINNLTAQASPQSAINDFYSHFSKSVIKKKKQIRKIFQSIQGASVVGFGAPAKGVTLLNYCGLGKDQISFIVDSTPFKQGRFMPGVHIPIHREEYLKHKKVDYIFLLAWNYKEEIIKKLHHMLSKKTKIIIPFPKLRVISLT